MYELVQQSGYLYVLLFMIEEDIFVPISQISDSNPRTRISVKEAAMLLGLIVKGNNSLLLEPEDISTFLAYRKKTYILLEELHFATNKHLIDRIRNDLAKWQNDKKTNISLNEEMANAQNQRETFFIQMSLLMI